MDRNSAVKISVIMGLAFIIAVSVYIAFFAAPQRAGQMQQFTIPLSSAGNAQITADLKAQGFIRSRLAMDLIFYLRGLNKKILPGGYELSKTMNAWEIAGVLLQKPSLAWVVINEGLRKEEIADILAQKLGWTDAMKNEWLAKDTVSPPEYFEGVYFPDTYLIPVDETLLQVAERFQKHFNEKFSPYAKEAAQKNIKWTTALTIASIIQREASKNDMALISGIIWNRLQIKMKLDMDSTLQYARGNQGNGWWAPVAVADKKIDSPYNTYLHAGLPPHPISDPGLEAMDAAINPAATTCLYYLHDSSKTIHCAATYEEQKQNIQKYLMQ